MFEAPVGGTWIDEIRKSELMDVPESLKRTRIQNLSLVRIQSNKYVNRVTDFVNRFDHKKMPEKEWSFPRAGRQAESIVTPESSR
jgi:hypothetical protein